MNIKVSSYPLCLFFNPGVAQSKGPASGPLRLFNFDLTGHQMFSVPLFHMFLQSAVHTEGHLANVTAVDLLTELAVRLHVAGELGALGARVVAQLALVRPLSGMAAPVHRQVAAVLEHLATVFAGVAPPAVLGAGATRTGAST